MLNESLNAITPEIEAEVVVLLGRIANVEAALDKSLKTAGLETVGTGDPSYFQGAKMAELRSEGRRLVAQLSQLLNVAPRCDSFGNSGANVSAWPGGFFG